MANDMLKVEVEPGIWVVMTYEEWLRFLDHDKSDD